MRLRYADAGKEGFRQGANSYRPGRDLTHVVAAATNSSYWRLMRLKDPRAYRVFCWAMIQGFQAAERRQEA